MMEGVPKGWNCPSGKMVSAGSLQSTMTGWAFTGYLVDVLLYLQPCRIRMPVPQHIFIAITACIISRALNRLGISTPVKTQMTWQFPVILKENHGEKKT